MTAPVLEWERWCPCCAEKMGMAGDLGLVSDVPQKVTLLSNSERSCGSDITQNESWVSPLGLCWRSKQGRRTTVRRLAVDSGCTTQAGSVSSEDGAIRRNRRPGWWRD